jgi:hypothetical protein
LGTRISASSSPSDRAFLRVISFRLLYELIVLGGLRLTKFFLKMVFLCFPSDGTGRDGRVACFMPRKMDRGDRVPVDFRS